MNEQRKLKETQDELVATIKLCVEYYRELRILQNALYHKELLELQKQAPNEFTKFQSYVLDDVSKQEWGEYEKAFDQARKEAEKRFINRLGRVPQ